MKEGQFEATIQKFFKANKRLSEALLQPYNENSSGIPQFNVLNSLSNCFGKFYGFTLFEMELK